MSTLVSMTKPQPLTLSSTLYSLVTLERQVSLGRLDQTLVHQSKVMLTMLTPPSLCLSWCSTRLSSFPSSLFTCDGSNSLGALAQVLRTHRKRFLSQCPVPCSWHPYPLNEPSWLQKANLIHPLPHFLSQSHLECWQMQGCNLSINSQQSTWAFVTLHILTRSRSSLVYMVLLVLCANSACASIFELHFWWAGWSGSPALHMPNHPWISTASSCLF